ncbi:hypothetical protein EII42_11090 [Tessaracoccus sp. OH4464_COT-324]|nr:hypothetical protein EII42_11090 [Tessaracoccus sp. OH4464_COT-324]
MQAVYSAWTPRRASGHTGEGQIGTGGFFTARRNARRRPAAAPAGAAPSLRCCPPAAPLPACPPAPRAPHRTAKGR